MLAAPPAASVINIVKVDVALGTEPVRLEKERRQQGRYPFSEL